MKKLLSSLLLLTVLASCKVVYKIPSESVPYAELSEGGGFTGAVNTYYLLKNGQVFQKAPNVVAMVALKSIAKRDARQYLEEIQKATNVATPVREPDNIYRVLRFVEKDTSYEAIWYGNRPDLDIIYNKIIQDIERKNAVLR